VNNRKAAPVHLLHIGEYEKGHVSGWGYRSPQQT